MTVLLTVVMKSRNPKTVFVVWIALGSSAMSPESAYIGATCIASGSDHTGLANRSERASERVGLPGPEGRDILGSIFGLLGVLGGCFFNSLSWSGR